jgi:hypothetical protein
LLGVRVARAYRQLVRHGGSILHDHVDDSHDRADRGRGG